MPLAETGSASVQDKEKALLSEILSRMKDMFHGTTENDQLSWLLGVKGKVMENETLAQEAGSNQKEQFDDSPALKTAIMDAIIEAMRERAREDGRSGVSPEEVARPRPLLPRGISVATALNATSTPPAFDGVGECCESRCFAAAWWFP